MCPRVLAFDSIAARLSQPDGQVPVVDDLGHGFRECLGTVPYEDVAAVSRGQSSKACIRRDDRPAHGPSLQDLVLYS